MILLIMPSCAKDNTDTYPAKATELLMFYNSADGQIQTTDNKIFLELYTSLVPKNDYPLSDLSKDYFEIYANNIMCRFYPQNRIITDLLKSSYAVLTEEETNKLYNFFTDTKNHLKNVDLVLCADVDNYTVSPLTQPQSKQLLNLLDNNNWVSGRTKTAYSHIIITPDNIYYFSTRYSEVINNLTNNTFCLIDENTKKQINKILD